jgi:hypothetical protein
VKNFVCFGSEISICVSQFLSPVVSIVTMDETSTLQIEAKLERERTNIALLEQNIEKYNQLTSSASSILKNFESRLLKVSGRFVGERY